MLSERIIGVPPFEPFPRSDELQLDYRFCHDLSDNISIAFDIFSKCTPSVYVWETMAVTMLLALM